MKWILAPFLWLLAVIVALCVLWRVWRGHNVVLRGRWGPRFVRMVVIVLVVLGVGVEKSEAAPVGLPKDGKKKPDESLPPSVTVYVLMNWLGLESPLGEWRRFKHGLVQLGHLPAAQKKGKAAPALLRLAEKLPAKFRALVVADLEAIQTGVPAPAPSARELTAALDELEKNGCFDHLASAYLWRKTAGALDGADRRAVIELFGRFERHARVTNALLVARSRMSPLMARPQAWRGKGGGGGIHQLALEAADPKNAAILLQIAAKVYPAMNSGTWQRDGLAVFRIAKGSAPVTLVRGGKGGMPMTEGEVRLGRLDLLETTPGKEPVILEHAWLGRIELPAGRVVSVWDLPSLLPEKTKDKVKQAVADALQGKEAAAVQIEQALPLAYPFVREAVAKSAGTPAAARLRLVLTQFDDVGTDVTAPIIIPPDLDIKQGLPKPGRPEIVPR
jgi:hypothetical protein